MNSPSPKALKKSQNLLRKVGQKVDQEDTISLQNLPEYSPRINLRKKHGKSPREFLDLIFFPFQLLGMVDHTYQHPPLNHSPVLNGIP